MSRFTPLDWQVAPWRDRANTLLLTGSAGGGKSRLATEKVHGYCLRYPGVTALILRKVRVTLANSVLLLLEKEVIGNTGVARHIPSKSRLEYVNGSMIAYAGLEDAAQRERVRSIGQNGVGIALMEEATEFEEDDYEAVIARMRDPTAPWRQIILNCNPDHPLHWIKVRLIDGGEASVHYSSAADNIYNAPDYVARLSALTGVEGLRLSRGLWVKAEGVIFDTYDDAEGQSVTVDAEYVPGGGDVYWFVDDGYSAGSRPMSAGKDPKTGYYVADAHPRVILFAQLRPTGQLAIFDEDYACLTLSSDHIAAALERPYAPPAMVVHGPGAAEIKGQLASHLLYSQQATVSVDESIKMLRVALAADSNGVRSVIIHPRCVHLRNELLTYSIDPATQKPVKAFDHGPDALRCGYYKLRVWL